MKKIMLSIFGLSLTALLATGASLPSGAAGRSTSVQLRIKEKLVLKDATELLQYAIRWAHRDPI